LKQLRRPPRHKARVLVLQALYAVDCGSTEPEVSIKRLANEASLSERYQQFATQLFQLTRENIDWADEQISSLLENWEIERINKIDCNILRMAMVELKHMPDVPVKVVINEAIEIAKTYSTDESSSFVNGILDGFANRLET
jgi:N utilization substance protein B